jgi:hypothetical protein
VIGAFAPASVPGIITAAGVTITALGGLVTALAVLLPLLRVSKDTHKIVNQQRTDMQRYQRALVAALHRAGVEVPVDQSVEPEDESGRPP